MDHDKSLVAGKLRRWEKYILDYSLPTWDEIPNLGLYMEQVIGLLGQYIDYMPPDLKEEQLITPSTINNYVRTKIMPEPVKKRYFRIHIAYLIMICTLKQSLSIAMITQIIPMGISEEEVKEIYNSYAECNRKAAQLFARQVRISAGPILDHEKVSEYEVESTKDLITSVAVIAGFSKLLAEKLILLSGRTIETGGNIEPAPDRK